MPSTLRWRAGGWRAVYDSGYFDLNSVSYGNGLFVAVANALGAQPKTLVSPDGETWTDHPSPAEFGTIAFGNGIFLASAASAAKYYRSIDGVSWEAVAGRLHSLWTEPPVNFDGGLETIVFAAGHFATFRAASEDGVSWTKWDPGLAPFELFTINNAFYGLTKEVPCFGECPSQNRYGYVTSSDGVTWTHVEDLKAPVTLPIWSSATACIGLRFPIGPFLMPDVVSGAKCDDQATSTGAGGSRGSCQTIASCCWATASSRATTG